MLVDHQIKLDIEPELKSPPPRSIRRRSGRGFLLKLDHVLFLPFILIALILLFVLFNSLGEIIVGLKPIQSSLWGLIFFTLFWNCCTAIFIWRLYALPLVYRWLVVHGQATLGHITEFSFGSGRGGGIYVHYEFSTKGGLPIKSKVEVLSMKSWEELKEGNTVITVLYSEKKPRWNVPYVCADYEVVADASQLINADARRAAFLSSLTSTIWQNAARRASGLIRRTVQRFLRSNLNIAGAIEEIIEGIC